MIGLEWFDDNPGGGGRYLVDVARGLTARGHAVTVLVPRLDAAAATDETRDGIAIRRFDGAGAGSRIRAAWQAVPGLLRDHGPFDVVHGHFALYSLAPFWHPRLAAAHRVCQFQGPWAEESRVEGGGRFGVLAKYAIERLAYGRVHRFIVLSKAFGTVLQRDYAVGGAQIAVVPSGIDMDRFHPAADRAAVRADLGWGAGPVVFAMRRLVKRMGLDVLLDAWAAVHRVRPDARLVIAGRGPLEAELRSQVERLGLGDVVTFAGRVSDEDLVRHYQAADLTVVPTIALEGFGLITVESLACGTPVIGTMQGGTAEILVGFDERLLVPPGRADALAERLIALLEPGARPTAAACRAFAEGHYAWPKVLDQIEPLLVAAP